MSYGEDLYEDRSLLRADVWVISGGFCEHPIKPERPRTFASGSARFAGTTFIKCGMPATELAHIESIGAGGRASADCVNNVFAACDLHARSSDNNSSDQWQHVPPPSDAKALAEWIREQRMKEGWAV